MLTIEHADNVTLQLGNLTDPAVRALVDRLANTGVAVRTAAQSLITPPALGEVWEGQGGYYVGILPAMGERAAQYMIASTQETRAKWGPDTDVQGASNRHDGRANTAALMAAGSRDFPAAWWCSDMQVGPLDDWHLPSQAELFLASLYAPQVFGKESWYWSSTQYSRVGAFVQDFEHGLSYWSNKDGDFRVRAVRWIPLGA